MTSDDLILVTGATGYIGRLLVPCLLNKGYRVRVLVRDISRVETQTWYNQVDVVEGDTLSLEKLSCALQGVSVAYYLIHNMSSGSNYTQREIESARNFASAACDAGVSRIIYLGGLANPEEKIGRHLRSRIETGQVLQQGCTPVIEFRASLIIGSGSISFEMIRYLTEQLPVIVAPVWLNNQVQPIAVENVLEYLTLALENEVCRNKIYEIGGRSVISYFDTVSTYARLRGLRRAVLTLPFLPVRIMSFFASRLTAVPDTITRPLIEGMRSYSVVLQHSAEQDFPQIQLLDYHTAVKNTLSRLSPGYLDLKLKKSEGSFRLTQEGFNIEAQSVEFDARPQDVYQILLNLGGRNGWLFMNWVWKLRGLLDRILGGPGMRGRSSNELLAEGDLVDFYQVENLRPGRMLRLRSTLKAPGEGWMEWRIHPRDEGRVELKQIAYFIPHGVPGFLYWNLLRPVHLIVFNGMIKAIARRAMALENQNVEELQT